MPVPPDMQPSYPVWMKLWTDWWKSAWSGGQHGCWLWIRCGRLKNLEITAGNPCADPRGGSRNTSLPETGTTPGATPGTQEEPGNRNFRREPGTSSRSMNRQPAGQPAGQRPATGQGPCISYMRGPCHFPGGVIGQPSRLSRSARCGSRTVAGSTARSTWWPDARAGENSAWLGPAGAGRQSKEMDAINPESARTDVSLAFRAPASRGTAADRERGAC